jgi:hypothetical protein
MGREEGCVTHFESLRYRLQAFVSTILKQLNKPPFLPQLCSISSKLVITHTMTPRPTVIGYKVIGVGLPAFLLSKNVYSESIGMSPLTATAIRPIQLARDLSGGTYRTTFTCSGFVSTNPETRRDLAFQLCLPQLPLSFCFVF